MTIKRKMICLSIFALIIITGSIFAQIKSDNSNGLVNQTHRTKYLSNIIADEFRHTSMDLTRLCQTYVSTGNQKYYDAYWDIVSWRAGKSPRPADVCQELYSGKIKKQTEIMRELGFTENEFALLQEATDNSNALIATEEQAMKSIKENIIAAGPCKPLEGESPQQFAQRIVFDDRYHEEVLKIMTPVSRFFEAINTRTHTKVSECTSSSKFWLKTSFAFQIVIGLLFAGFVLSIRSILIQLGGEPADAARITEKVAEGNLNLSLDKGSENSGLHGSIIKMTNNLRQMIKDLTENSDMLTKASEEMASVSSQMAFSAKEMSLQSEMIASGSEQVSSSVRTVASAAGQASSSVSNIADMTDDMSSTFRNIADSSQKTAEKVSQIAGAAKEISEGISKVASAVEEMSTSLNEVAQNTARASQISKKATHQSDDINNRMDKLVSASKKIEKIIGVIKNIADQTNMLALNATIEAASAGEAGKGFAVVAGEVKELAKQSAEATDEIATHIEQIQITTNDTVNGIVGIGKIISEIADLNESNATAVEEQTAIAGEISRTMTYNAESVEEVARSVNETSKLVDGIANATKEISKTAVNVASYLDELSNGARDVANSCVESAKGVEEISMNAQAINQAAKQTAAGANKTNIASTELSEMARKLNELVNQFSL